MLGRIRQYRRCRNFWRFKRSTFWEFSNDPVGTRIIEVLGLALIFRVPSLSDFKKRTVVFLVDSNMSLL